MTTVDLSQYSESEEFTAPPAGVYRCKVNASDFSTSKNGNPMVTLQYKVAEGEYEDRVFFDHLVLSEKEGAIRNLKAKLRALLGEEEANQTIDEDWLESLADSGKLLGTTIKVKTKTKMYEDERRAEVKRIAPDTETVDSESAL